MKELRFHGDCIVTGSGSMDYLKKLELGRVFIVTGAGSTFKYGTIARLEEILKSAGSEYCIYSGVRQNPTTEVVLDGVARMREFKPDTVIGVGGGSPIDAAKVMSLFYDYPEYDFEKAAVEALPDRRKHIRLIAIPTTSGTGTEVTRSAVITYTKDNIKIGLKAQSFIPDIAILDSSLTLTMPKKVVAETGMDAMTHAVECFINKNVDDFTACLASGAVEGLFAYLASSWKNGDAESREKVHNYQSIAGCAFANVGLGLAHGIAHSIGGFFDLGHGLINAVVLPYILEFNSRDMEVKAKLDYLARRIAKPDFISAIRELNAQLEIPSSFKEMGIEQAVFEENLGLLAENSLKGSTRVNPVPVTKGEMEGLLRRLYEGRREAAEDAEYDGKGAFCNKTIGNC